MNTTDCTCPTTDTYRQLDPDCPTHGHEAEHQRRIPTTIDEALDEISAARDAFTADPDMIGRVDADDAEAYTKAPSCSIVRTGLRSCWAELLTHRLNIPAGMFDQGRSDILQGISEPGVLYRLDHAVELYRDRREAEAIEHLIATFDTMLDQAPAVRTPTRDWLIASMRAVMVRDTMRPPEGDVEVFDEVVTRFFRSAVDQRLSAHRESKATVTS